MKAASEMTAGLAASEGEGVWAGQRETHPLLVLGARLSLHHLGNGGMRASAESSRKILESSLIEIIQTEHS